jgi:predicted transposase/invertase (TIGR01784 family)
VDIVSGKHDGFFKALMEQPGTAGALLRERLPKAIADALGPGEPELIEGTFIDQELRESRSDRLYRMELKAGGPAYVFCLVEHKSAPDARIAWQLLRYMARVWDKIDREAASRGKLPPVVPLVVYHGVTEWTAPRCFSGMVEASAEMAPHLLDFPFEVVDVGRVDDAELSRQRVLRVGLLLLKHAMVEANEPSIEVVAAVLEQVKGEPDRFLSQVLRYIIGSYEQIDKASLVEVLKRAMPEKEKQMLSIAAREWLAEGRAEGKVEGKAEGKAEGVATALLRVLARRFGDVPAEVRDRVSNAAIGELEAWLDRAVDAPTVQAVFGPSAH